MVPIKHKGQTVERVVRQSGHSITGVAERLRISRNTLYNKFSNPNLSFDFIMRVGEIINYDFAADFPEMKREAEEISEDKKGRYVDREDSEYARFMKKHVLLANKYCRLLELLVKLSNENEHVSIKKDIAQFVEESKSALLREESEEDFSDSTSGYASRGSSSDPVGEPPEV